MTHRTAVLVGAILLNLAAGGILAWRMSEWHERGWTGLRYAGTTDDSRLPSTPFTRMLPEPGEVVAVLAGAPAARAGIVPSHRIQAVNGVPITDTAGIARVAHSMRRGDTIVYTTPNGPVEVRSISPLRLPVVSVNSISNFLVGVAFVAASVFVFWQQPKARAARIFVLLCAVGAVGFSIGSIVEFEVNSYEGVQPFQLSGAIGLLYGAYGLLALALMNLLFHFSLIFPKPLPVLDRNPRLLVWIHTLPFLPIVFVPVAVLARFLSTATNRTTAVAVFLAAALAALTAVVVRKRRGVPLLAQPWTLEAAGMSLCGAILFFLRGLIQRSEPATLGVIVGLAVGALYLLYIAAVSLLTIAALMAGYQRSSLEEKRQVRWPLWGTIVAIGISVVLSTALILLAQRVPQDSPQIIGLGLLLRLAYVLIPVSFAIGILKYRVMEIDILIRKTVVYSFVTGLGVLIFFGAVAGAGSFLTGLLGIQNQTLTVITTLLVVALFVPIRNRLQRIVDRKFLQRGIDLVERERMLGQELMRAADLPQFLSRSTELIQQAVSARSLVVMVRESDADTLSPASSLGLAEHQVRHLELESAALRGARALNALADLRLIEEERARLRRAGTELIVSLTLRGKVVGALLVGSRLRAEYDEDEQRFLAAAGEQLALGVDNLSVSIEARDLERARDIQRALLPQRLPRIEGLDIDAEWVPARIVGGDYFDVFPVGDQVALCIADVAGKGMPAALLMATLQAAVRATVREGIEPDEVCSRVGSVVCGTLEGGRFITFFFALLDPRGKTIRYTNAGHNPPVLLHQDGSSDRLEEGGPVFAHLMRGAGFVTRQQSLRDGDRLVLFTDGVTEARNAEEEEFGEDRLVASASAGTTAAEMLRAIVSNVEAFSGSSATDDLTLMCVRVT